MLYKNIVSSVVTAGCLWTGSVFAANNRVVCVADGNTLGREGLGLTEAVANFEFVDTKDTKGRRVLRDFRGEVVTDPANERHEGSYIGRFKIDEAVEDVTYRPRVYIGFSQFEGIEAVDTEGSAEAGMDGVFLLEKDTSRPHFAAKFLMKAGSHMGGTLHLGCHRVR
ncbi:MAG: hypothetical protein RIQ81_1140 [Pseudomonadota bacterium]|jgi:hypothetical protein